ncbi:lysoplasmalogenase-like protein TMEM86A isoform X2 [Acipenser ruthenus]|uniref:lysoplasmalogenase-like protein TMEM86A isoform X2 n=1 Tax=Acipenser ruthenus TaxID=7906 RepID=UPI00145BE812|nr:lysoplasmalogenase-like protein TMEM86A isoform X2 [Acipenser ruthenus]XP_034772667.2 lysoplasmalogenase-like protein TMEM86A isoform X2 [Acipenser ruthenus]
MGSVSYLLRGAKWGSMLSKCLPVFLCCVYLLYRTSHQRGRYHKFILAGLLLSSLGDACLIYSHLFIVGMAFFAVAHISYICAFGWSPLNPFPLAVILPVEGLIFFTVLLPELPGLLVYLIPLYILLLGTMVWRSLVVPLPRDAWLFAATGGVSFMVSDTALAIDKFCTPLPYAEAVIMGTYYLAQILLTLSATDGTEQHREPRKKKH